MIGSRGAQCLDWIVQRVGSAVVDSINMTTARAGGGSVARRVVAKSSFCSQRKKKTLIQALSKVSEATPVMIICTIGSHVRVVDRIKTASK